MPAGLTGATAVSGGSFHSIALGARPVFTADAPPATTPLATPFSYTFATGGATTFELASGSLPAGLALTSAGVLAANYPFATKDPNVGRVKVPDARLDELAPVGVTAGDRYPDMSSVGR